MRLGLNVIGVGLQLTDELQDRGRTNNGLELRTEDHYRVEENVEMDRGWTGTLTRTGYCEQSASLSKRVVRQEILLTVLLC